MLRIFGRLRNLPKRAPRLLIRRPEVDDLTSRHILIIHRAIGVFHQISWSCQKSHGHLQPERHQSWHCLYCFQQARHCRQGCQGTERTLGRWTPNEGMLLHHRQSDHSVLIPTQIEVVVDATHAPQVAAPKPLTERVA